MRAMKNKSPIFTFLYCKQLHKDRPNVLTDHTKDWCESMGSKVVKVWTLKLTIWHIMKKSKTKKMIMS
uniref:Uncharacterized protein n=1 Tax=Anguilla anguilla TaxID=7936 RepID=A0A0E9XQP9_ANGAN